ncbi:probable E3 ubiquitin-protein ligase RHY1A isoform X2 [Impatiens glandulifera]|uniref:probable E3 ubiquitin-protein ligase RHY1A isoform X2 n=1 Tax=Impatiens glandulifera TaxID=253017 RepID=UPI001FB17B7C|nr:probable E3 ubiquitin-protein ligase RHY1A isoform X2 [Impatiens glandulifera]
MAGMLPGVESARRRRFHQTGGGFSDSTIGTVGSTRRSSFCLYSSNFASHNSFALRNTTNQIYQVEELGGVARVAKDRLDERLKAQWKSDSKRNDVRNNNGTEDVIGMMKNKRLKWGKLILGRKVASSSSSSSTCSSGREQEECAICLEGFKVGEIMQIACGHRFHSGCLIPWLDANAHCPCCRMGVTP